MVVWVVTFHRLGHCDYFIQCESISLDDYLLGPVWQAQRSGNKARHICSMSSYDGIATIAWDTGLCMLGIDNYGDNIYLRRVRWRAEKIHEHPRDEADRR